MATVAQMQTDLAAAEAALRALYTAVNFESGSGGAGGGRIKVEVGEQVKFLQSEIARLKLSLAAAQGQLTAADQERTGVDADRSTDNGDGQV